MSESIPCHFFACQWVYSFPRIVLAIKYLNLPKKRDVEVGPYPLSCVFSDHTKCFLAWAQVFPCMGPEDQPWNLGDWVGNSQSQPHALSCQLDRKHEPCLSRCMWMSGDQAESLAVAWNRKVFEILNCILCNRFLTPFIKHQRLRFHCS